MRNTMRYMAWLLLPLLAACNDYLKSDSDDLLIPESVNDYAPILLGEAYPDDLWYDLEQIHLMTDDVEMGPLYYDAAFDMSRVLDGIDGDTEGENAYTWGEISENIWEHYYNGILGCNVIIEALPEMTYTESEYDLYCKLAAQAYTLRAYYYFSLVNLYAAPWSEENLDEPGVVMRMSPDITADAVGRSTVGEIYELINADLAEAERYFPEARNQYMKWEISPAAFWFLKSRVALFQEDWEGVLAAGQTFMDLGGHELTDLNEVDLELCGFISSAMSNGFWINDSEESEVVFCFAKESNTTFTYFAGGTTSFQNFTLGYHPSWTGEGALLNLYEEGDLRREVYFGRMFYQGDDQYDVAAYQALPLKGQDVREAWRSPEVWLNMAEAYARQSEGVSQDAIDLLNELREKKLTPEAYVAKTVGDFASKDELVWFIWEERRRELCFEEAMRFWDLRRQGMPEIRHTLYRTDGSSSTYVLEAGSPNYLLQIPIAETDYNSAIENNPRDIIVGQ